MDYPKWYSEYADKYGHLLKENGKYLSDRRAAVVIGKGKTTANAFMRWLAENDSAPQGNSEVTEELSVSDKDRTWVDPRSQMIFTDLGSDFGIVAFTQSEFRAIRRDYSKHFGGKAVSQTEIALRYNFPSAGAFDVFRRIHQLRQNSIPFTDTELAEESDEALLEKLEASRRQGFYLKMQERERVDEKRDAEKWRMLEVNLQAVIASTVKPTKPVSHLMLPPAKEPYALMISLTDLHLGKRAQLPDRTVIWDRKKAAETALKATGDLLNQALASYETPDEIMLLIASDGLTADNPMLTTTGGTSMAGQTDGTYREMVEDYLMMVRQAVALCVPFAPVRLLVVEGNHDRVTSMMLGLMLEQLYRDDSRIHVERQMEQGMILVNYAKTTLAFTHGEFLRGNKGAQLWPAITALAREKEMPIQPNILSFQGHLHHEASVDLGGIRHHTLAALTPADEYHRRALFVGAVVEAQAFVIRRCGGKGAVLYSHPGVLN